MLDGPEALEDEKKVLKQMLEVCEKNGKPCCINLITEADNKFLKKLQKEEDMKAKLVTAEASAGEQVEESKAEEEDLTSEQREAMKAKEHEETETEDEVGALIRREEEEHMRAEQEREERHRVESEEADARKIREGKEAHRLEEIR